MYSLFKFIAFKLDPEMVHEKTIELGKKAPFLSKVFCSDDLRDAMKYRVKIGSKSWCFPVGLAAGLDKNGEAIDFFSGLKFGAIEVGTLTPKPQSGNPRPRLFRYPVDKSLRNKMGFNNQGMDEGFKNIIRRKSLKCLGINLGKNKTTSEENAYQDYRMLYDKFAAIADYLVINVSSPNTPGLRDLQKKEAMEIILNSLDESRKSKPVDLYIKLSPDMNFEDIDQVIDLAIAKRLTGLIATNTTRMDSMGDGGVSGKLLSKKASEVRKYILKKIKGSDLEFIGVGGISTYHELKEFWSHGGKVVQIYTSFIYDGPEVLERFKKEIDRDLEFHGVETVEELIKKLVT